MLSVACHSSHHLDFLSLPHKDRMKNKMYTMYNNLTKNINKNVSKAINYHKPLADLEPSWERVFEVAKVRNPGQVIKL